MIMNNNAVNRKLNILYYTNLNTPNCFAQTIHGVKNSLVQVTAIYNIASNFAYNTIERVKHSTTNVTLNHLSINNSDRVMNYQLTIVRRSWCIYLNILRQ